MKALIIKELRENIRIAALGLLLFAVVLGGEYVGFRDTLSRALRGEIGFSSIASPLLAIGYEQSLMMCAIFAGVLGWLQVARERRHDVWGFLAHRPATLTTVFLSKVIAGLTIYATCAGVPLLMFVLSSARPGTVPAPFDWWMVAPLAVAFASGPVYYLGGLLGGARRARWFASRAIGFGLPIFVSGAAISAPGLAQVVVLWLFAIAVLGIAAWASFCNFGYDLAQQPAGRPTAAIALASGWTIVLIIASALVSDVVERIKGQPPSASYFVARNGSVYITWIGQTRAPAVTDLQGKSVSNPSTGQPLRIADIVEDQAKSIGMSKPFVTEQNWKRSWLARTWSYRYWGSGGRRVWFCMLAEGRLQGYDINTGRFVGSIGPAGFATDLKGKGDRFDIWSDSTPGTGTELFAIDLDRATVRSIFSTSPDDPIVAAGEVQGSSRQWEHTLVATRQSVSLITPKGELVWRTPIALPPDVNARPLHAYSVEPGNSFVFWIDPPILPNRRRPIEGPKMVAWIHEGKVTDTTSLPPLRKEGGPWVQEYIMSAVMPPAMLTVMPLYLPDEGPAVWRRLLLVSLIAALVCMPVSYLLARRSGLSHRGCVSWTVGTLFLGLPGVLALLSTEEKRVAQEQAKDSGKTRIFEKVAERHAERSAV